MLLNFGSALAAISAGGQNESWYSLAAAICSMLCASSTQPQGRSLSLTMYSHRVRKDPGGFR